jgi:hypothetical protein
MESVTGAAESEKRVEGKVACQVKGQFGRD